jgi:predicted RNase H-like HicB family nuclease
MPAYIGLIHKEPDSSYGVQFPDLPGHVTAGDTLDEAFQRAHELIHQLARHWREDTGEDMPKPRRLQDITAALAGDDIFDDAIMIAVSTGNRVFQQAAE